MGYDRGDSFLINIEPNGIQFCSKLEYFGTHLNQMEFQLVQNREEKCHHDHIPFNLKGTGNIVFSVRRGFELLFLQLMLLPYFLIKCVSENKSKDLQQLYLFYT